jgi:SAM-dependent methyltransferase
MDVWGDIFRDHWSGRVHPHFIERDDGFVNRFDSAASYFRAPRSDGEREVLDSVAGPVLDLGAGPGSYALYYQRRGLPVTAADSSPGALAVCRERGCSDVQVMDLRALRLETAGYGAILIMGNTLGLHQTPETLPGLLRSLCRALDPGGALICNTIDPLDTLADEHLRYHRMNRERGLPPGLVKIRLKYKDLVDDWTDLWMPTSTELRDACADAECELVEEKSLGHERLRLLRGAG